MTQLFEDLNIHGIPEIDETCIMASLLSGEPTLLIGPPGTAKTEIIYMIGSALRESSKREFPNDQSKWFKFNIYDTSKINFEDLIGWPNPNALRDGKVAFIESATTIWDKDMIGLDELNRCAEDRQANLFEVIRNRTCMGSPTNVKFIFSAINPFGDAGTNNLSSAIIDRHIFFVHFSAFDKMSSDDRKKVIQRIGNFDSVGIRHWTKTVSKLDNRDFTDNGTVIVNDYLADQGDRIKDIIKEAADVYSIICNQLNKPITALVDTLVQRFSTDKEANKLPSISGRRAGMIARAIFAYRAIQLATAKVIGTTPQSIKDVAYSTIVKCIPIGVDKPVSGDILTKIEHMVGEVCNYWEKTIGNQTDGLSNVLYDIYYNPCPITKLELLLKHSNINNLVTTKAWKDLSEDNEEIGAILLHLQKVLPDVIPSHVISKDKQAKIEAYLDLCEKTLQLSQYTEVFESDFVELLDPSNHKHNVTYACAIFEAIRINKTAKSYADVQLSLKIAKNLIARCTEIIDEKTNNATNAKKEPE